MKGFQAFFQQPLVWAGIAAPIVIQLIFLLIMLPGLRWAPDHTDHLQVAIVNDDPATGKQVADQLASHLPFVIERDDSLAAARAAMAAGNVQMVIHIPKGFSQAFWQGNAEVDFEIEQAAPLLSKQVMMAVVQSASAQLNAFAFATRKQGILQGLEAALPPQASQALGTRLQAAFAALTPTPLKANVVQLHAAAGLVPIFAPLFLVLTAFAGAIGMAALQPRTRLAGRVGSWSAFAGQQMATIIAALILPAVTIGLLAAFDTPLKMGTVQAWGLLALGYWAMFALAQALVALLGRPGLVIAALLLPFQLVTAGLIVPAQVLPAAYAWLSHYLPATYLGRNLLHLMFGGGTTAATNWALVWIGLASVAVWSIAVALRRKPCWRRGSAEGLG